MARSNGRTALAGTLAAAALLSAPSFVAPSAQEAPRQMQAQTRSTAASSTASTTQEAGQLHMAAAGGSAAIMGAVAALGPRRAAAKRSRQAVATRAAKQEAPEGLSELVALAEQLVHQPGPQQLSLLVQQLQAFAAAELRRSAALSAPAARAFEEVVSGANEALASSADKQLKWAAGAAASLLLTFSVTLQPAFAADVVPLAALFPGLQMQATASTAFVESQDHGLRRSGFADLHLASLHPSSLEQLHAGSDHRAFEFGASRLEFRWSKAMVAESRQLRAGRRRGRDSSGFGEDAEHDVKDALQEKLGVPVQEQRLLLGSEARLNGSDVQRKDGMELLFAPEEVQADRELVTLAVQRCGDALALAAEEIRGDRDVAMAAAAWQHLRHWD
eukprot:s5227_g5.t1